MFGPDGEPITRGRGRWKGDLEKAFARGRGKPGVTLRTWEADGKCPLVWEGRRLLIITSNDDFGSIFMLCLAKEMVVMWDSAEIPLQRGQRASCLAQLTFQSSCCLEVHRAII